MPQHVGTVIFLAVVVLLLIYVWYLHLYEQSLWLPGDPPWIRCVGTSMNRFALWGARGALRHSACLLESTMDREAAKRLAIQRRATPRAGGICFYGDSEFTTWYNLETDMRQFLDGRECLNAGFGGARTLDLVRHHQDLVTQWHPAAVVLHVGGNNWDFHANVDDAKFDLQAFATSVCEDVVGVARVIQGAAGDAGDAEAPKLPVFVLFTPPRPNHGVAKIQFGKELQQKLKQVSEIEVIDITDMSHLENHFRIDHAHLNEEGHRAKAQILGPKLRERITTNTA